MDEARKIFVCKVDRDVARWFQEEFLPMRGGVQWFLETCITTAHRLSQEGKIEGPVDLVTAVVQEVGDRSL